MSRITSAEFQKNFGKFKRHALSEPITVTIHGKDTLVVMSHELYSEMMSGRLPAERSRDGAETGRPDFPAPIAPFRSRRD